MTRALRRHHQERLKAKRKHYYMAGDKSPRAIGMVTTTPALCSCMGCGNRRKHQGDSIAERSDKNRADFLSTITHRDDLADRIINDDLLEYDYDEYHPEPYYGEK